MQNNYFTLRSQQKSSGQLAASFLLQILPSLKSTRGIDYDLTKLIPDKDSRREFAKNLAIHFDDEEELQTLEEDLDYDPVKHTDWMVAEYLACLLDPTLDTRSQEQKWKEQEKFYDMLLRDIDKDLNQKYSPEEIEAMKRVQRKLDNNE